MHKKFVKFFKGNRFWNCFDQTCVYSNGFPLWETLVHENIYLVFGTNSDGFICLNKQIPC